MIDGKGGVVTPGLIDMHQHLTLNGGTSAGNNWDAYVQEAHASRAAEYLLRSGFTTIRDIAGNTIGLKRAINMGILPGPRMYTSGPALGPTGGVASEFDPIDLNSPSLDEMKAAVQVANEYGGYVAIHGYTDAAYNKSLDAGVKSFEHGFLVSEKTVKRMAKEGAWADILIWNGDPTQNVKLILEVDNLLFIMKDGKSYKNLLVPPTHESFRGELKPSGHSFSM